MKRNRNGWIWIMVLMLFWMGPVWAAEAMGPTPDPGWTVIEIDYGSEQAVKKVALPLVRGKTALEVLQSVAVVETEAVGPYRFVVSIDGVAARRGEKAWYYEVDGRPARQLAHTQVLDGPRQVRWRFKEDVCTPRSSGVSLTQGKGGE